MAHPITIRTLIALAVANGWYLRQGDVKTAYLNAELPKPVYLRPPNEIYFGVLHVFADRTTIAAARRVLRYLAETRNEGIQFKYDAGGGIGPNAVKVYADTSDTDC
eukprot:3681258-Rhodomonas_salina.1